MVRIGVALGVALVAGNAALCAPAGPGSRAGAPGRLGGEATMGEVATGEGVNGAVSRAGGERTGQAGTAGQGEGGAAVGAVPVAGGAGAAAGSVAADAGSVAAAPGSVAAIEQALVQLVNRERESRGIAALVPDARLTEAARGHSREMCDLGYFDHRSPTEGLYTPADRFLRVLAGRGEAAPTHMLLGENIYHISEFNHVFDAAFGHRAIMNSPSHRAAILEPRYTRIGVGAYRDARGELWATEMFLRDTPWTGSAHVAGPAGAGW